MKNLYLLGLMGIGIVAQAQTSKYPAVKTDKAQPSVNMRNVDYNAPSPVINSNTKPSTPGYYKSAGWITVGETNFDRQTNSSVYRRVKAFPNGKVSVNWATSSDGPENNYLGRGSGYNHFNGTSWGPISSARIEATRTGYPSYDYNGTTEIVMSHKVDTAGKSGGLSYNTNGAIGGTTWSETAVLTPAPNKPSVLWPRTVVSGNYMHVIATYSGTLSPGQDTMYVSGVNSPTVYSRYNFATSSWEVSNITLPGYDATRWYDGQADGYAMDAVGSTVAIVMGGTTSDITLWKSTDNGSSWTTTIIDSFPVPAFNDQVEILDTPAVSDGSMALRLDANGMAHCFWGRLRVLNSVAEDNTFSVFLGTNSIDYWFEGRPDSIVSIAGALDINGNGTLDIGDLDSRNRYGNAGVSTMPYCVRNAAGDLFVVYSAITEGSEDVDPQGSNYRDVYITYSKDNGATWSNAQDLTAAMGIFKEQMFASADVDDTNLHLTFMESDAVGFYSATDNPSKVAVFPIRYYKIPVADVFAGNVSLNNINSLFTVATNYPNPFHNSTIIPVNLTEKADVNVTVMNILGEVVYTNTFNNTSTGVNRFEINGNFTSGFYFYTVEAKGFKVSGKMLAE